MSVHFHPAIKDRQAPELSRRYPRILVSVPITVRYLCPGGIKSTRGISLDLGVGGLGAILEGEVPLGETVALDFRLNDQPVNAAAIVRHTSDIRCGFEFLGLTTEERSQIRNMVGEA